MNEGTIKRVSYQLSIFGVLKPLIPIGFNVRQISEIEHDSELRHPPHPPKKGELEALRGRIGEHKTKDG
ncbi:MAG: hypothetical protein JWL81_1475, partial [Verrucomicrobiales bacterium]|nr:hypothetical protein [Verrucomicrobiales bacterium]